MLEAARVNDFDDLDDLHAESGQESYEHDGESSVTDETSDAEADEDEQDAALEMDEKPANSIEAQSYEVKANEGRINEELLYQNTRKKKLKELDKKQRHLLLFTNYD